MTKILRTLEIRLKGGDLLEDSYSKLHNMLEDARARPGSDGIEAFTDKDDPSHVMVLVRWESQEARDAYGAYRRTPEGAQSMTPYNEVKAAPTVIGEWLLDGAI